MIKSRTRAPRGSVLVDRELQGKLIFRSAVHWTTFVVASASLGLMIQFCSDPFAGASVNIHRFWTAFGPTLLVLACLMPVFIYDFVKFSHRFVGPILRTRGVLRDLADGKSPGKVTFRENDFNAEIAEDLNGIIEIIRNAKVGEHNSDAPFEDVEAGPAPSRQTTSN
jgi:hypothetical protein